MTIKNVVLMNGKEVDFESLDEEEKRRVTNTLNRTGLKQLNYIEDKTA